MLGAVIVALGIVLGIIQLASDAMNSEAAANATVPRLVPKTFGRFVYERLDAVAAAPYVETTLAQNALVDGDADAAWRYAVRLPSSPIRDELLARAALLQGRPVLAREYFIAAPDPAAVTAAAHSLAIRDPEAGYALEQLLRRRLLRTATHPDAIADTDWELGRLANREAWRQVPGSGVQRAWLQRALRDLEAAQRTAPLSERYAVEAANQADLLGERVRAQELFARAIDVDPGSADAVAGLGVVAWQNGDRQSAQRDLTRARALDSRSLMVRALERDLGSQ